MALLGALGHLANLGQFVEIGQGHAHQKEQIRWTHRNYRLDVQALKIDLLGAARDDVRGTYDTYIERLDTLLLVNALLLPFALNTLQFSDGFLPQTEDECKGDCVEVDHPEIVSFWVYLVAWSIIMPFWSLLLLLWCKIKMDHWLQVTLAELQNLRRDIITRPVLPAAAGGSVHRGLDENAYAEHEEIVTILGSFIVEHQDIFTELWSEQCAPMVNRATRLLWSSACVSVALVGLMFWMYLVNRHGRQHSANIHFAWVLLLGLVAPVVLYVYQWYRGQSPNFAHRSTVLRRTSSLNLSPTVVAPSARTLSTQLATATASRGSTTRGCSARETDRATELLAR